MCLSPNPTTHTMPPKSKTGAKCKHGQQPNFCPPLPPNDGEHKPYTYDDSCIQVRFDPHVKSTRRRKSSLAQQGGEDPDRNGAAFLHKLLGLEDVEELEEEDREVGKGKAVGPAISMTRGQLHDMVLGLREMGRKYGMCLSTVGIAPEVQAADK
jgi:hypothetical protein